MPIVQITIECREFFTLEVEAETAEIDDPAVQALYHSGDWGKAEDIQSNIINVQEIK